MTGYNGETKLHKILDKFLIHNFMKLKLIIFFLLTSLSGYSGINHKPDTQQTLIGAVSINQTVYVCTGSYAYAYHSRSNCPGLNNCKGEIKYTDEDYARTGLNRKPCCICWSNVFGNCQNDNPSGVGSGGSGSGGNNDAMAAVGIAILAGSAAVLSNDFYILNNFEIAPKGYSEQSFSFGFRKLLKQSAFEYGASKNYFWKINLGYLQKIHSWGNDENLNLYVGPIANMYLGPIAAYDSKIGFGGVLSSQYTLGKVVKLDLRYELTSNTNRVSLGLIFHYQDRYFWQR